jgi:outer membrane protein, multidrug efflux system
MRSYALGLLSRPGQCASVLVLCGCALSTPPSQDDVLKQALPKGTQIPPAWRSSGAPNGEVENGWVKSFGDPGLEAAVAEAIANNLDLRQAAASVQIAQQTVVVVGAQLLPQVSAKLGGAYTIDNQPGANFASAAANVGASWQIDVWGRLRAQQASAQASFEATQLDYAFARQSLAATTAKNWYLAIETSQLLGLTEEAVKIYTELLALVKIRRAAGKVTDLDVSEASGNLNTAKSQFVAVQGLNLEARRSLELLLGRYPAAEIEIARTFAALPPPIQPGLPSALLNRRPDVSAAQRQVLAAFRVQESAKLALLPEFSLTLVGGYLSDQLLSLLSLNPWLLHAGVGMVVPIYTGGALEAKVAIATAQQEQMVARYGSIVLTAFREVESALTNERLLAQRIEHDQNAVKDRNSAVQIATLKYKAGAMDLLSVLVLQASALSSQEGVIKLLGSQRVNRINLHLALGGDFATPPPPPAPVNPLASSAAF